MGAKINVFTAHFFFYVCAAVWIKQNEYVRKLPPTFDEERQKFTQLYKSFHWGIKLTLLRVFTLWTLKALFLSEGQDPLTASLDASLNIQSRRSAGKKTNLPLPLRTCARWRLRKCCWSTRSPHAVAVITSSCRCCSQQEKKNKTFSTNVRSALPKTSVRDSLKRNRAAPRMVVTTRCPYLTDTQQIKVGTTTFFGLCVCLFSLQSAGGNSVINFQKSRFPWNYADCYCQREPVSPSPLLGLCFSYPTISNIQQKVQNQQAEEW